MLGRPVAVLLACLVGAACGGGGGEGEATPEATAEAPATPTGVHGRAPAAVGGVPAIVLLTPVDRDVEPPTGQGPRPAPGDAVIDQFGLAFSPRVLVVAAGTPVVFTNSEGALTHNVQVRSIAGDSTVFNGDAASGERIEVDLPGAGGYDVLCDMHPGMAAFVFAAETPYAVAADADGTFDAGTLPPGAYRVRLWTVDGGYGPEREVRVGEGPTELDLTADAGSP